MPGYRLSVAAEADLTGIWDYTFETWGEAQADRYLEQMEACFERIAAGQAVCRDFPEIDTRLQSCHCEHHYVFFLTSNTDVIIIAVLHERMDLMTRLQGRLK